MQCVVLAGGLGTRMKPYTETMPKNLIPVGQTPFVFYQLSWAASHGIDHVVMCIGYRGDMIRSCVGDGARFGLRVDYVEDGAVPLGTGGPLRKALDANLLSDWFLVLYGDSFLPFSPKTLGDSFLRQERPAMMTVYRNEGRWVSGNVHLMDGVVTLYQKGSSDLPFVDYGMTALRQSLVRDRVPPQIPYEMEQAYHELSVDGLLAGLEVTERFYEIGSPAGLADFEAWIRSEDRSWPGL